jgi:excisionase family DNA binding protein
MRIAPGHSQSLVAEQLGNVSQRGPQIGGTDWRRYDDIGQEHMLATLAVWDYCETSARFIFGDSVGYPMLTEAAEALRLSTRTVREYVKRGEIRGKLIGKRWRFRRADLDAFFKKAPSQRDFVGKNSDGD